MEEVLIREKEKIINMEDRNIIEKILSDFKKQNFPTLSPQEIQFLKLNPEDTWCNYLIFRYKFNSYPAQHIVSDFPNYLLIEPVSACNLRCVMCFQIDESFSANKEFMGKMDFELFKKIIDDAYYGGTKAITLASRGEPTLHPELDKMLEYCSGKFYELKLNTNGTRLSDKLSHQILKSGVTDLVFSIDSYEKQEYESIRVKGVFEQVLNNVIKFKEIKEQYYPNSKCTTRVSGVKVNKNQDQKTFKEFWEKYVDHVVLVEIENRWDTYHNPTSVAGHGPCPYLWERMYIWYDGICNPCDSDYKSELAVGSVKEKSIKEIWHGFKYTKLRQDHLGGKRNCCFPCDRCPNDS